MLLLIIVPISSEPGDELIVSMTLSTAMLSSNGGSMMATHIFIKHISECIVILSVGYVVKVLNYLVQIELKH